MSRDPAFEDWIERARAMPIGQALAVVTRGGCGDPRKAVNIPCPGCGGTDRFSVNLRRNLFFCRKSRAAGDAIALAMHVDGCDFLAAVQTLTGEPPPGRADSPAVRAARERRVKELRDQRDAEQARAEAAFNRFRAREMARARSIWQEAGPLAGSPAEAYLARRGVAAPAGANLRCAVALPYWHRVGERMTVVHTGPAMVAAITGCDGRFTGCHITWIDLARPKGKAEIACPESGELLDAKKVRGAQRGGHIHLGGAAEAPHLVIGEGIETVLSGFAGLAAAGQAGDCLFWSAVNLGNIGGPAAATVAHPEKTLTDSRGRTRRARVPGPAPRPSDDVLMPPATARRITILADGDSDRFTTLMCLKRGAARWRDSGRTIRVAWPPPGCDFNDMVMSGVAP